MLFRFSLACALITAVIHVAVLITDQTVGFQDPVSFLSHARLGSLHTLGLVLFGSAQIMLAIALADRDPGRFWPYGRGLLAAAGTMLFFIAYYFAVSDRESLAGTEAFDPLWIVACLVGLAMTLLRPGFKRLSASLARFNDGCLVAWCLLVPATLLIGVISLGSYERAVGLVYVGWVAGLGFLGSRIDPANKHSGS
jgi:hypothetical protein